MSELQPLLELLSDERETEVPFAAFLDGDPVVVTAILDRTAVIHPVPDGPRRLVRKTSLMARPRDVSHGALKITSWHGRPREKNA